MRKTCRVILLSDRRTGLSRSNQAGVVYHFDWQRLRKKQSTPVIPKGCPPEAARRNQVRDSVGDVIERHNTRGPAQYAVLIGSTSCRINPMAKGRTAGIGSVVQPKVFLDIGNIRSGKSARSFPGEFFRSASYPAESILNHGSPTTAGRPFVLVKAVWTRGLGNPRLSVPLVY